MKVAALFSGGKDSCYALWKVMKRNLESASLILVHPENPDSWMFHYPNVQWSEMQAKAIDLPYEVVKTTGRKEEELEDLEKCLEYLQNSSNVDAIVSGAIASRYQKDRIDRLCNKLGIQSLTPLWGINQATLVEEEIKAGFEIVITSCKALGFDKNWLGRKITYECLMELLELNEKYGVNIAGEGGEYETIVTDGPFFKKRIKIVDSNKKWIDNSGYLIIKNARLEEKI
ncbi:TIGR00289 family protein [Candidatus Pacearchaeota archaeon]|nr:TIGR00289 family protein [Candidatus Pacearchaeota archaeon]